MEECLVPKNCLMRLKLDNVCSLHTVCQPIVDQCVGCNKVEKGYCRLYAAPAVRWRTTKICPSSSHVKAEAKVEKKINPLKQAKQSMRNLRK